MTNAEIIAKQNELLKEFIRLQSAIVDQNKSIDKVIDGLKELNSKINKRGTI